MECVSIEVLRSEGSGWIMRGGTVGLGKGCCRRSREMASVTLDWFILGSPSGVGELLRVRGG